MAGAGKYWVRKHQPAHQSTGSTCKNILYIYSIYSILFYSVVYNCAYIRKPANAGEVNELLVVFLIINHSESRRN